MSVTDTFIIQVDFTDDPTDDRIEHIEYTPTRNGGGLNDFGAWVRAQPEGTPRSALAREGIRHFSSLQYWNISMALYKALDLPEAEYESLDELVAEEQAKYEAETKEAAREADRAVQRQRRAAKPEKPRGMSNVAIAEKLGISERRFYTLLKNKTVSRDQAEKIAHYKGGEAEDYLRSPRPRGPVRQWPFKEFVCENANEAEGRERQSWEWLAFRFDGLYESCKSAMLPDFESLDALLSAMRNRGDFDIQARDAAPELWKRFRIWREKQLCAERVSAIESEEDFG